MNLVGAQCRSDDSVIDTEYPRGLGGVQPHCIKLQKVCIFTQPQTSRHMLWAAIFRQEDSVSMSDAFCAFDILLDCSTGIRARHRCLYSQLVHTRQHSRWLLLLTLPSQSNTYTFQRGRHGNPNANYGGTADTDA